MEQIWGTHSWANQTNDMRGSDEEKRDSSVNSEIALKILELRIERLLTANFSDLEQENGKD